MPSSTSIDGITAFVRALTLNEDRREANPRLRDRIPPAARVTFDLHAREFYSYGRHFPLAHYSPAKRGKSALWIINGDRWGGGGWSLTSRHQSETRSAIETACADAAKLGKRVRSIVIPFSALTGAGVTLDSIRPIHVREDRREPFANTAKIPRWYIDRAELPTREYAETLSRSNDPKGQAILYSDTLAGSLKLTVTKVSKTSGDTETFARTAKFTRSICWRGYDYTADNGEGKPRGAYLDYDPPKVTLWLDGSDTCQVIDNGNPDTVTLAWTSERHWLGDSLFSAERRGKRSRFISSFDYNERAPLYYLAALPASSRASTLEMATDDLAPAAVHAAYARGLDVKRQGDIFAIPTTLTDADVYARSIRRTRLTMHTRGGVKIKPGELGYNAPLPGAAEIAKTKLRRDTFLAELRGFMLADARPNTAKGFRSAKRAKIAECRERIARHEARIAAGESHTGYAGYTADNAARGIIRENAEIVAELAKSRKRSSGYAKETTPSAKYGKCYSRALNAWREACRIADARYTPRVDMAAIRETLAIHGTGHTATEVAVCAGGVTYARGILRHMPEIAGERRGSDHTAVKLDPGIWYLMIRNAVPRQ